MRKLVLLVALALAAVLPSAGRAATEVSITSPAAGAHSLSGIVPVTVSASATMGIYSVQLKVDGVAVGNPVFAPSSPYTYVIPWSTSGVTVGNHTLVATATDWSLPIPPYGVPTDSAPVVVDVGPAYPTVSLDSPAAWSYVRGTTTLRATAAAAVAPLSVQFAVDGAPVATSAAAPWTASWTTGADGAHVVSVTATDGRGKTASASAQVTVDNTRPNAAISVPATQGTYQSGSIAVQATASDAYGVASVQFLLDGVPAGGVLTAPDAGTQYTYSATLPVSGASGSQHRVQALAVDRAGNSRTSSAVRFLIGTSAPSVTIASPADYSFARGVVPVTSTPQGGVPPYSVRLLVDGRATSLSTGAAPYTLQWDTRPLAAGAHTLQASVTDSQGRGSTSTAVHVTVDNTSPTVALTSPPANGSFTTSLPASATASDANGVASVQFAIDGALFGPVLTSPEGGTGYAYSATLSLTGITSGSHSLTAVAVDRAGNKATSAAVTFTVGGAAPPRATISLPPDWSYGRGITPLTVTVTGGTAPITVKLVLDGAATGVSTSTSPYVLQWDTRTTADGTHTLQASVLDALSAGSTSTAIHVTVDNTPPSTYLIAPSAGLSIGTSAFTFKAHASDAYGIKSLQFTIDGAPVGPVLTAPDGGSGYTYSATIDVSPLAAGAHTVGATVVDNAGNTASAASVSVKSGPVEYLPVLNYHEINPPDGYSIYDETPAQADAELAYLQANGYTAVTLDQYRRWLAGENIGIAKPVLITVDDGLKSEQAWDTLLAKHGLRAVLFVNTGYADQSTPGAVDPNNMTWADIQALAATGRWEIGLHAGRYGHGDYSDGVTRIGTMRYSSSCPYFYSCLGVGETVSAMETAVQNEVAAAKTELAQKVPGAAVTAFAAPFNDAGQWTNLYNDPSNQVKSWLPGYLGAQFQLVFIQTSPVTYGQASGLVGSLTGFNRRYRFEVHTGTTIGQFAAALTDPAFAR